MLSVTNQNSVKILILAQCVMRNIYTQNQRGSGNHALLWVIL